MQASQARSLMDYGYYADTYQTVTYKPHMLVIRYGETYYVTALDAGNLVIDGGYVSFERC